ncbi:GNAT family N-acetyltransferase [Nocardioides humi]|uniref:GNAT family N-acetyltransferase n=1 Tax=Nocardioides humi TaxID=449461 RepID=A0ABN2BQK5_9ACTN|nr:GNAT family N-acetyltransferase [Nocardioides humi]
MDQPITTPRLSLRPWRRADAPAATRIFGDPQVARWLAPALPPVPDETEMTRTIVRWQAETGVPGEPVGHWAITSRGGDDVVGGVAVRDLGTGDGDYELAWQLAPAAWGRGYAAEAARALAVAVLDRSPVDELLALVRPRNRRAAATARRLGMEWVGETDKFHRLRLQVYRLRRADLLPSLLKEAARSRVLRDGQLAVAHPEDLLPALRIP